MMQQQVWQTCPMQLRRANSLRWPAHTKTPQSRQKPPLPLTSLLNCTTGSFNAMRFTFVFFFTPT
jgi:hypothetical protein